MNGSEGERRRFDWRVQRAETSLSSMGNMGASIIIAVVVIGPRRPCQGHPAARARAGG
ncbi:unnamed protein product [Ectocarpus sp. 12 AP-2014]